MKQNGFCYGNVTMHTIIITDAFICDFNVAVCERTTIFYVS